jgi:AAA family ATP:ADP antiporter
MKNYLEFLNSLTPEIKRNGFFIFLTYFFALFSYPLARSSTGAIFYDSYTSNEYSFATFISVVALIFIISVSNKLQKKIGIHKLYSAIGVLTILSMLMCFFLYQMGFNSFAYALFAIKEVYIVLLIHLCLAFSNAYFSMEQVKRLYGPLGGAGSIGGIVGGQLTSSLAKGYGTNIVLFTSLVIILMTTIAFYQTKSAKLKEDKEVKDKNPLESIEGIRKYVFLIALIVALTQFVIFIADLQFNIVFEKVVETKNERTAYLGQIYKYVNVVTLFLQFVTLPFLLMRVQIRSIFFFIPILYLALIFGGLSLGAGALFAVAGVYISMKATDYSIFAVAKEVMYHPLESTQKFGAKYITDIFVYRTSKALIAFVMSFFAVKQMGSLNTLQAGFIIIWLFVIFLLFKEQKNKSLFSKE